MEWNGICALLTIVLAVVLFWAVREFLMRSVRGLYDNELADLDERLRRVELRLGNGGEK